MYLISNLKDREIIFFNLYDEVLSSDCKIAELIMIDPHKYKNLKIKLNNIDNCKVSSQLIKTPNINNLIDIWDLDGKKIFYRNEIDNKDKNNYNLNLSSNNNHYSELIKNEINKALLVTEFDKNIKVESSTSGKNNYVHSNKKLLSNN